jgi:membrane protein required for colicin V production
MQGYDIVMLVVLAAAIIFGAWKGLAWQLAMLASIFVSYFAAMQFRGPVSQMIGAEPPWNRLIAMLVIYLACSLLIWISFGILRRIIARIRLKEFDRHAGAILGAVNGAILCTIITLFSVTLLDDHKKQAVTSSYSGYYIAKVLDKAHGLMPEEVHTVLHPYIHKLDHRLDDPSPVHHDENKSTPPSDTEHTASGATDTDHH